MAARATKARAKKPPVTTPLPRAASLIRDRIKEFKRIPRDELMDNPDNWRVHPFAQRLALQELLSKVGISGVCTAYHSERNGGKLTLIDGHMRKEEIHGPLPTVILDVTDEEADLLLLSLDPMREMAAFDNQKLEKLLEQARLETPALQDMLRNLQNDMRDRTNELLASVEQENVGEGREIPEMELQPFESYDYVVVVFRTLTDFMSATARFGIRQEGFTLKDGSTRKTGLGRVVDGAKLLSMMK